MEPAPKDAMHAADEREHRSIPNRVKAKFVNGTERETLQGFVRDNAKTGAKVYTDDHSGNQELPFEHEAVKHSVREYIRGLGPHRWHGELLVSTQARLPRNLSQDEREALGAVCGGVLWSS